MRSRSSCAAVLGIIIACGGIACSSRHGAPRADELRVSDLTIGPRERALIEELVSPFPPAHETGDVPFFGSDGFTQAGGLNTGDIAESVSLAQEELRRGGIRSFPTLVEASDDERYSSSSIVQAWVNRSVGNTCYNLVEEMLGLNFWLYIARETPTGDAFSARYFDHIRETVGMKRWWSDHAVPTLTLKELRREALQWMIEEETRRGFISEKQRRDILKPLEDRLRETR